MTREEIYRGIAEKDSEIFTYMKELRDPQTGVVNMYMPLPADWKITDNGILNRKRIVDPSSGRQLEVDAGYKYYYTNGQGAYIGTNDEFFNPARDPNLNHQEWRKSPPGNPIPAFAFRAV